jgi:hypothetical protein
VSRVPAFIGRATARWAALPPAFRALNVGLLVSAAAMLGIAVWVALDEGAPEWAETLTGMLAWAALALAVVLLLQGRRGRRR